MDDFNDLLVPAASQLDIYDEEEHQIPITSPALPASKHRCVEPIKHSFHRTAVVCLQRIRDCIFHHQWKEAAQLLSSYFQILEDTSTKRQQQAAEVIWRLGIEILHHHPNCKPEDFLHFYGQIKNMGVKCYLRACLEHSFHLMLSGCHGEGRRQLSIAEGWRYGKRSAAQSEQQKLVHAYRGFLDYMLWANMEGDTADDTGAVQDMQYHYRQASLCLKDVVKMPGVWDSFISSYVTMLEHYNDQDEALSMLKDYAYDNSFPPNPNAYVYLYQYLRRHRAPNKELIKVLWILWNLVPSHELMLDLCSLLQMLGNSKHLIESARVIFSLLDHSSWKHSCKAWTCMKKTLKLLYHHHGSKQQIPEEWKARKSWWPHFHFRTFHAKTDFKLSEELISVKACVAAALLGQRCMYCRRKRQLFNNKRLKGASHQQTQR